MLKVLEACKRGLKYILIVGNLVLLVSCAYYTFVHHQKTPKDQSVPCVSYPQNNTTKVTTEIHETTKEGSVTTSFIAKDVVTKTTAKIDTPVRVQQEIDLTPLVNTVVKHELPKWEAGVGIGVSKDKGLLLPLSMQRNYKTDRGIEITAVLDVSDGKLDTVMVQHKWLFK